MIVSLAVLVLSGCAAASAEQHSELFNERARNAHVEEPYRRIDVKVPFDPVPAPEPQDDLVMSYPVPKTVTEEQAAQQIDWQNAAEWSR